MYDQFICAFFLVKVWGVGTEKLNYARVGVLRGRFCRDRDSDP